MPDSEKIVAVGLLTEKELRTFGADLKRIYPVPADGTFDDLLEKIARASAHAKRAKRSSDRVD